MALFSYRYRPEIDAGNDPAWPPVARLADDHDRFVASPVHDLQQQLWLLADGSEEPEITPWPGWARLTVVVGGSLALWAPVIWGIRLILYR